MARVTTEIRDHVAHVTLTRPDKMNGVDQAMAEAIVEAGEALCGDADLRAVVLSGEGRAFCAGLDVASFAMLAGQDPEAVVMPRLEGKNSNLFQEVALVWRRVPVPVIAALQGVVFGAGFQLALGADIRIAHPETRLAVMEMKWGLVPDMGGMVLMPHLMRSDVIRRMTYTAEPVLAAEHGLDWGMVTEVVGYAAGGGAGAGRDHCGQEPNGGAGGQAADRRGRERGGRGCGAAGGEPGADRPDWQAAPDGGDCREYGQAGGEVRVTGRWGERPACEGESRGERLRRRSGGLTGFGGKMLVSARKLHPGCDVSGARSRKG